MNKLFINGFFIFSLTLLSIGLFAQNRQIIVGKDYENKNNVVFIDERNNSATLKFDLNELNLIETETDYGMMYKMASGQAPVMLDEGKPELFYLPAAIIIPDTGSTELEIVYGEFTEVENVDIAPSKGSLPRSIDPETVPFKKGEVYEINEFFPGIPAMLNDPFIMRDVRGQTIFAYPVQYNPVTKILRVYSEITVTANYTDNVGINEFTNQKRHKTIEPEFSNIYNRLFLNHSTIQGRGYPTGEEGELLIICHPPFMDAMKPYIDWKRTIGRKVTIVPTSTTGTTASAIKTYIANYYNNPANNLAYVLFVGDAPQIPISNTGDVDYAKITGGDHFLEILIGRFSAETVAHVQTQVQRSIWYERDITTSDTWLSAAIGIGANEGNGNGHDSGESDYVHINNIRNRMLNYGYDPVYQEYTGVSGIPNTNATQMSQRFNTGASIANYCNHGSQTSWSVANYSNSHVNALQNAGKLPFIFSVACNNGELTYSTPCFAEAWMRATQNNQPTGAVATYMAYVSLSWQPGMTAQDEFVNICMDLPSPYSSYGQPGTLRSFAGACLNSTQKSLMVHPNVTSLANALADFNSWIVFGDPALMMRTKTPQAMTISHLPVLFLGMSSFTVECNAEGALATITYLDENNEVVLAGKATVQGGVAEIIFNEPVTTPMDLILTIIGKDKVTHQDIIPALPAAQPYIILQSYELSENADFGKTVSVNFELKNVSNEPFTAYNVIVNVETESQYVSFPELPVVIGDIEAGTIYFSENELFVTIAENVPNNEKIVLNLLISCEYDDEVYEWEVPVRFQAYAPTLEIHQIFIENKNGVRINQFIKDDDNYLGVTFYNEGFADLENVNVALSIISDYMTIDANTAEIEILKSGHIVTVKFLVTTLGNAPAGTPVNMVIRASSGAFTNNTVYVNTIGNAINYFMANGTLTTDYCNFYDSKGPNNPYSPNENLKLTFLPKTSDKKLKISFSAFAVEEENDNLYIYDGISVSENLLMATLTGLEIPQNYEATNEEGALTFVFKSNETVQLAGWSAVIYEMDIYHNVSFVVKGNNNETITDALIIFDGYVLAKNQFTVPLVKSGVYSYSVIKEGYPEKTGYVTVSDEDVELNIELRDLYNVTFNVSVEDSPIEGAIIEINDEMQQTDVDGIAIFILKTGEYEYTVSKEGYQTKTGIFTIEENDENIEIVLEYTTYNLTFIVHNGFPVEGALVEIDNQTQFTDIEGIAEFVLKTGDYDFTVTKEGYFPEIGNVTIENEDEEVPVLLTLVSIELSRFSEFYVFPNPFNDIIYIGGNSSLIKKAYINNMLGQTLKEIYLEGKTSFSTEKLPKGIYSISFERYDKKLETIKMIKK